MGDYSIIGQYTNGNQTMHEYDALGNRVRTTYYTRKSLTAVPIGNILHPENNVSDYTVTVDGFNDNIVYAKVNPTTYNGTTWMPKFVHNPEGMMRHYSYEEHYPFYFIKDHLGNIRETYINPAPNTKYLIQRMQYYPSGIPWKTSTGANEHPYRYSGKELVQMHGQDEYDSHARWYYPAICRTTTMDPLCEKYYNISPYAWCENNPVNVVDISGNDTLWFDEHGNYSHTTTAEGEHVGCIKMADGSVRPFHFINQSDADRFGDEYEEQYLFEPNKNPDISPLNRVCLVSNEQIEQLMKESYAYPYPRLISWMYALIASCGGRLDYTTSVNSVIDVKDKKALYLPENSNIAHDPSNFGNFLWGHAMASLNIPYFEAVAGAHLYSMYDSYVKSEKQSFQLDSFDDQMSIMMGYFYGIPAIRNMFLPW